MNNIKICFFCATVFEESNEKVLQCPCCGEKVMVNKYELILKDVRDAVHYGWDYRRRYEKDLKEEGKITKRYFLFDPETILSFIAVAAVSGIIGGVAHDTVKKVINKIIHTFKDLGGVETNSKIFELIENDENMNKFVQYIDEYYNCFDSINEEVRNAIFEEMIVDKISPTLEKIIQSENPNINVDNIKEINPFSEEEIFKSMIEVRRDLENKKKLDSTVFQDFWKNID